MMHVILVPKNGAHVSLPPRHVLAVALTLGLGLPALVGAVSYKLSELTAIPPGERAALRAIQQGELVAEQRQQLEVARRNAETHLNALAQRLGMLQAQVLRLNALGQRLTQMAGLDKKEFNFAELPGVGGPPASPGTARDATVPDFLRSLESLSVELERKGERLNALEGLLIDRKLQSTVFPQGWPTDGGFVSSGFGTRTDPFTGRTSQHEGLDIAARHGSPVRALGGGMVSFVGEKEGREGYGLVVEVNHGKGYTTRYAHVGSSLVKIGDRIEKGQTIATVGNTGRATGPHLHLEVLHDGGQVNPRTYLRLPQEG